MTVSLYEISQNTACDESDFLLGSGTIKLTTFGGLVLSTMKFGNPAFFKASGGVAQAHLIASDLDCAATGTVAFYKCYNDLMQLFFSGTVGLATIGQYDMYINTTRIEQHGTCRIDIFNLAWPPICFATTTTLYEPMQEPAVVAVGHELDGGTIKLLAAGGLVLSSGMTFSNPAFGAVAAGGIVTANAIGTDNNPANTGTAVEFQFLDATSKLIMSGSVGVAGSGADLIMNTNNIIAGVAVSITSLTMQVPQRCSP